jgi:hypothetical protein
VRERFFRVLGLAFERGGYLFYCLGQRVPVRRKNQQISSLLYLPDDIVDRQVFSAPDVQNPAFDVQKSQPDS